MPKEEKNPTYYSVHVTSKKWDERVDWMKGLIIKTAKKGHFETAKTGMGILFNPTLSPTISLAASYYNESQLL